MEDEACAIGDVFAVFDGHAGANAAKLCAAALASVLANQLAKAVRKEKKKDEKSFRSSLLMSRTMIGRKEQLPHLLSCIIM